MRGSSRALPAAGTSSELSCRSMNLKGSTLRAAIGRLVTVLYDEGEEHVLPLAVR